MYSGIARALILSSGLLLAAHAQADATTLTAQDLARCAAQVETLRTDSAVLTQRNAEYERQLSESRVESILEFRESGSQTESEVFSRAINRAVEMTGSRFGYFHLLTGDENASVGLVGAPLAAGSVTPGTCDLASGRQSNEP